MSSLRRILIGLGALAAFSAWAGRAYQRRVEAVPPSLPEPTGFLDPEPIPVDELAEFVRRWEERYTGPRP